MSSSERSRFDRMRAFVDVRRRAKQLLLKPIATPFLVLFGVTKLIEPGTQNVFWMKFIAITAALFVIGDDIQRWLRNRGDDND